MTNNPHVHHTDGPADEDAYRRGFQQGASAVLEMLQNNVSPTRSDFWWAAGRACAPDNAARWGTPSPPGPDPRHEKELRTAPAPNATGPAVML